MEHEVSTKIHNGFTVNSSSMQEVLEMVDKFRPFVQQKGKEMLGNYIKSMTQSGKVTNASAYIKWMDVQSEIRRTKIRNPAFDTDFELIFFPDGNRMLGIMYCEHPNWCREWLAQPKVSEYAYWNNTDRPANLSAEEWDARGEAWDRVLAHHIPSMNGFSICVQDPNGVNNV